MRPTEADMQAGMPGQVRGHLPPRAIPTAAGPDTVCVCGHWWEEHAEGDIETDGSTDICGGCDAAGLPLTAILHDFAFDPEANTPAAIADRGGEPDRWPQWVKDTRLTGDCPMIATLEPCRAGFDGCDAMRAEAIRKHPRTPRLAECEHLPIPPERPDKLQGPEVGSLCLYQNRYQPEPMVVRVLERSYVWAPGDRSYGGGSRRYDWKVIARGPGGTRSLCVDDKDLTPIDPDSAATLVEGMTL